jgi:hypothetical protein
MRIVSRIGIGLGAIVLAAVLIALSAPKATHALVATLVQVVNTSANPVPTQIVNNPARQAVVLTTNVTIFDGAIIASGAFQDNSGTYTVPAGMRLVVESTSGFISLPTGQKPVLFRFSVLVNGVLGLLQSVPIFISTDGFTDYYEWLTQSTTYADPGTQVTVTFDRFPYRSGIAECSATLSGHLESIN